MKKNIIKIISVVVLIILVIGVYFLKKSNVINTSNSDIFTYSDISTDEFDIKEITSHNVPVIIDFYADYCGPCKDFDKTLTKIKTKYGNRIIIKKVDIEKYPELANQYHVSGIPAQLYFKADGSPYVPPEELMLNMSLLQDEQGKHIATLHTSASSYGKMELIVDDLLGGPVNEDPDDIGGY